MRSCGCFLCDNCQLPMERKCQLCGHKLKKQYDLNDKKDCQKIETQIIDPKKASINLTETIQF